MAGSAEVEESSTAARNLDKPSENPQTVEEGSAEKEKPKKPRNLVTSWGSGAANKTTAQPKPAPPAQTKAPPRVSSGATKIPKGDEPHSGRVVKPRTETPTRKILRKAVAQSIESARNSPRRTGTVPKRLGTNTSEPRLLRSRAQSSDIANSLNKARATRKRTLSKSPGATYRASSRGRPALPRSPDTLKRARNRLGRSKENDEVESKKIQLAAHRKLNEKTSRGLLKPPSRPLAVTKPMKFKFARVKDNAKDRKEFTNTLRSNVKGSSVAESSTGTTARKRRHSADPKSPSKYMSMAE